MENIIKTISEVKSTDVVGYLDRLLDVEKRDLLSPQEVSILSFMEESYKNSGSIPTVEYLVGKFPEFKVSLGKAKTLSLDDLHVEYSNLISKRLNLAASKVLMEVATDVSKNGLTYEHLDRIRGYLSISDDVVVDHTESVASFMEFYKDKKSKPIGMLTYIKEIDEAIGGIGYGMMANISAFTSQYKTVCANNIAYNNVIRNKYNIAYISLEVPKEDIMINQLARHSYEPDFDKFNYIANARIRNVSLSDEEEDYLFNVVAKDYYDYTKHGMLKVLDETDFKTLSFGEIRQKLEDVDDEMKKKTGYGLDCIIVDHVNLLKFNGAGKKFSSEFAEGNAYISFFRKLGLAFRKDENGEVRKLIVITLAQINRAGWQKASKNKGRYNLNALAEFNEIERGSQVIMTIFTNPEMKEAKEATVQLLKNRNGATIEEPISVFADGETYVFGDEMQGYSSTISSSEMDELFNTDGLGDLMGGL